MALLATSMPAFGESPQHIAEVHFKAGLKQLEQGAYESARLEFLQAQAVYPRPSLLRNLALCELKTNRPLDALNHLRAYLADPSTTGERREAAKKNLEDAFAQTAHLKVQATLGATISVDGQPHGVAPLKEPIDLMPGKHVLEVRLDERIVLRDVATPAGIVVEEDVRFAEPVTTSAVRLDSASMVPMHPIPEAPRQEPPSSARWAWPAGLGVGFVVGMGLGAGFASAHASSIAEAERLSASVPGGNVCANAASPGCIARQEKLASASEQAMISNVAYVGGALLGVAAITTAVLMLRSRSSKSALAVTPNIGIGSGGFSFSPSFNF